jgi:cation:H+ antiporter
MWLFLLGWKWLEVWIWTIWWSAIFNVLIIPAFVLLFYRWKNFINVEVKWIKRDSIFYFLSIIIFLFWLYFSQLTMMWITLVTLYTIYIFYLYKSSLDHRQKNIKQVQDAYESVKNKKVSYFKILISLIIIYIWVEVSIIAWQRIWEKLNVSILVISLVLLAGITSIPDALLSIKASKKWDIDAWLSNAVGSNIFDICIGLWLPVLIWTLVMNLHPKIDFDQNIGVFIFLLMSVIVYFIILSKNQLSKKDWIWLLFLYLLFIGYLVHS